MTQTMKIPFNVGLGAGRDDEPQPVEIEFEGGGKTTFKLRPFTRKVQAEMKAAGFDPEITLEDASNPDTYERDVWLAERLVAGWEPGITRPDGSMWEYKGVDDAKALAGIFGVVPVLTLAALQLAVEMRQEEEGNSESLSDATTAPEAS